MLKRFHDSRKLAATLRVLPQVEIFISMNFFPSLQLVLKHRQGKNHKMRIVVFVGSPVDADEKDVSHLNMMESSLSCFALSTKPWRKSIKVIGVVKVIKTK